MRTSYPGLPRLVGSLLFVATMLGVVAAPGQAEEPRRPTLGGLRYDAPASYRSLPPHLGSAKRLEGLARQLRGTTPQDTIRGIWRWIERNLKVRPSEVSGWRTVDAMIAQGARRGSGEYVVAFGALLRAAGIPTIWVKGVALPSIEQAQGAGNDPGRLEVRLLLEVHLDGAWRLLDPRTMALWSQYDPSSRRLPASGIAYDKSGDPRTLVLPNQREAFDAQTRRWLQELDPRTLPWGTGTDLLLDRRVVVAGTTRITRYVRATSESLGFRLQSTLRPEEIEAAWRTRIAGRVLVVTVQGDAPVLPAALRTRILPQGWEALLAARASRANEALQHRLSDGTRVIFLVGTSYESVEIALAGALTE